MEAKPTFSMTILSKTLLSVIIIVIIGIIGCDDDDDSSEDGAFTLTVLHNNDSESELLGQDDFGGVAQFATLVELLKNEALAESDNRAVVMLSSGDNFLAGPEFDASLEKGVPFFDTIALDLIGYDALQWETTTLTSVPMCWLTLLRDLALLFLSSAPT